MNYQDVKTFKELAEAIQKYINRHKVPCQDSITGEASMQLFTSLSTTDARLAFIRLKNRSGVDLPVPNDLIGLLDSCGAADRKLQKSKGGKKKKAVKTKITEKKYQPWKNSGNVCFIIEGNKIIFHYKDKSTNLRLKAESNTYRLLRLLAGGSLQADEIQEELSSGTSNKASKIVNYANGLLNKKIPMVGFVGVPSNVEFIKRDGFGSYQLCYKMHTKEDFERLQREEPVEDDRWQKNLNDADESY